MAKHQKAVQQMSQDEFFKCAEAIPLVAEGRARAGKVRAYKVLLDGKFFGCERGNTPLEAMKRAHEGAVMDGIECHMPNASTWLPRAPLPSAIAAQPYPKLRDQLAMILASRREVTA